MYIQNNSLIAELGKVIVRISDEQVYGESVTLGYTYYIGGKRLKKPLLELPEHFKEEYIVDTEYISQRSNEGNV